MILDSLKEGLAGGNREGRSCLAASVLLSVSVYLSGMDVVTSLAVVALSSLYTSFKSVKLIKAFVPFYIPVILTAPFFGVEHAVKTLLAFLAVIAAGALIFATSYTEIAGALLFFKVPKKLVSMISIAIAIMPVVVSDFNNIRFVHTGSNLSAYSRVLKAFVSTLILRSLSYSESLYSKNYQYGVMYDLRKPGAVDVAMLALSAVLVLQSFI